VSPLLSVAVAVAVSPSVPVAVAASPSWSRTFPQQFRGQGPQPPNQQKQCKTSSSWLKHQVADTRAANVYTACDVTDAFHIAVTYAWQDPRNEPLAGPTNIYIYIYIGVDAPAQPFREASCVFHVVFLLFSG
jgi:hypothetical protein